LGTEATVKSGAYERAISAIDSKICVRSVACPMFVPLVENGYTKGEAAELFVREYLASYVDFGADAVILGCTHYPHLSETIGSFLKGSELVNSGREAAEAVSALISAEDAMDGKAEFYVSDTPESFARLAGVFLKRDAKEGVERIDIESY